MRSLYIALFFSLGATSLSARAGEITAADLNSASDSLRVVCNCLNPQNPMSRSSNCAAITPTFMNDMQNGGTLFPGQTHTGGLNPMVNPAQNPMLNPNGAFVPNPQVPQMQQFPGFQPSR